MILGLKRECIPFSQSGYLFCLVSKESTQIILLTAHRALRPQGLGSFLGQGLGREVSLPSRLTSVTRNKILVVICLGARRPISPLVKVCLFTS